MNILETALEEVKIVEPRIFQDDRGMFYESYQRRRYREEAGIDRNFVQDNVSFSTRGTLRGLHYQLPHMQAKLVQVLKGEVFDVAVDIRRGSPTFGQWVGVLLSDSNCRQLFIPEGFAHGFCTLTERVICIYKCSEFYMPNSEKGILWSDPDLNINWPIKNPILSRKDQMYSRLKDIPLGDLPSY